MRLTMGSIDLADEDVVLLKASAALKDWSMRQYIANALQGFLQVKKSEILNTVYLRAKKYGIEPQEALNRLVAGTGFNDLEVVNPSPLLSAEEREQSVKMFSLRDFELHPEGK